jgi:glucose-6-phosphate dehydrogenase assembly protein OpcA
MEINVTRWNMPIETQANPVPFSPGKGVDVDRIEKELASMWSNVSDSNDESSQAGVTRCCALNLIVYTTPMDDRNQLEELLSRVNDQHPGRTLILVADRETENSGLEAYVSMRCRVLGSTGKQICGEQVTIEARGALVETAATAVAPLLFPDVPVYLWWKDIPHYEDRLFDRMAQMADRIVIDSAAFDHPYDDLVRLKEMICDESRRLHVSDLNWGRLTSWRTLLASFWDVPAYRPLLDKTDHVTVRYRPSSEAPSEIGTTALLLAGWLAARLSWELVPNGIRLKEGNAECELRAGDRQIILSLVRDQAAERNDRMISSVIVAAEKQAASFSVALRANGTKLETEASIGTEHSLGRVLGYERRSDADRLSRELAFLSRDTIYEEAMAMAAQLVESIRDQNA